LNLREKFIQESFIKFQPQTEQAWWQEPGIIVGGVVISFSLGIVIGAVFIK
jgi:hypothetical protein